LCYGSNSLVLPWICRLRPLPFWETKNFVLIGLWLGLRIAFHQLEPDAVYRVYRYALVGLWGGLGAPWLFVRLKLAEKKPFENADLGMRNAEL